MNLYRLFTNKRGSPRDPTPIIRSGSTLNSGSPPLAKINRRVASNPLTPTDLAFVEEKLSTLVPTRMEHHNTTQTFTNSAWKGGTKVSESLQQPKTGPRKLKSIRQALLNKITQRKKPPPTNNELHWEHNGVKPPQKLVIHKKGVNGKRASPSPVLAAPVGTELTKDIVALIKQPEQVLTLHNGTFILTPRSSSRIGSPLSTPTSAIFRRQGSSLGAPLVRAPSGSARGSARLKKNLTLEKKMRLGTQFKTMTVQQLEKQLYECAKNNDIQAVELLLVRYVLSGTAGALVRTQEEEETQMEEKEWIDDDASDEEQQDVSKSKKSKPTKIINIDAVKVEESKKTALHIACQFNHSEIVSLLIEAGANINITDISSKTPLHMACSSGSREATILLCGNGANVNVRDENGTSPLHLACRNHHFQCAKDLLLFNADINFKRYDGITVLHECMINGDIETLDFILMQSNELRYEVLMNSKDEMGDTPMFKAILNCQCDIIKHLLTLRDKSLLGFNSRNNMGYNVFHIAKSVPMLNLLLEILNEEEPVVVESPSEFKFFNFEFASTPEVEESSPMGSNKVLPPSISLKVLRLLNEGDRTGQTPLHVAVKNNRKECVEWFLSRTSKYDPTKISVEVTPSPSLNVRKKSRSCLTHPCINVNAVDSKGNTALHVAITKYGTKESDLEIVKMLYNIDGRSDVKNVKGETVKKLMEKYAIKL